MFFEQCCGLMAVVAELGAVDEDFEGFAHARVSC